MGGEIRSGDCHGNGAGQRLAGRFRTGHASGRNLRHEHLELCGDIRGHHTFRAAWSALSRGPAPPEHLPWRLNARQPTITLTPEQGPCMPPCEVLPAASPRSSPEVCEGLPSARGADSSHRSGAGVAEASLPVSRPAHPGAVRLGVADVSAAVRDAIPELALEVVDAGWQVEPDDDIARAMGLRLLLGGELLERRGGALSETRQGQ